MSDFLPSQVDPNEPLQFDNAEYPTEASGRLTCTACHREVDDVYYEINGQTVCDPCRVLIEGQMKNGSRLLRLARASLFGSIAAVAGFAIYFGIMKLTGLEIGLISILVGFMVGSAVKAGSRHRGGWAYQGLAIFLTYTAISASYSATYLPEWFADLAEKERAQQAEVDQRADGMIKATNELLAAKQVAEPDPENEAEGEGEALEVATPDSEPAPTTEAKVVDAAEPDQVPEPDQAAKAEVAAAIQALEADPVQRPKNTSEAIVLLLLFLLGIMVLGYSLPILAGMSSPIGLIIVGFALWEAWKLNRRVPLEFNGPFMIGGEYDAPRELPSDA